MLLNPEGKIRYLSSKYLLSSFCYWWKDSWKFSMSELKFFVRSCEYYLGQFLFLYMYYKIHDKIPYLLLLVLVENHSHLENCHRFAFRLRFVTKLQCSKILWKVEFDFCNDTNCKIYFLMLFNNNNFECWTWIKWSRNQKAADILFIFIYLENPCHNWVCSGGFILPLWTPLRQWE